MSRHAPSEREERRDDGASTGAGDVVEIVAEHERVVAPELGLEHALHLAQDFQREHAADAAAVEGEQPVRRCLVDLLGY